MKSHKARLAASLLVFVSLATSVSAQLLRADVDEFGTQDGIDLWIPATAFVPVDHIDDGWQRFVPDHGYFTALGFFEAHVPLPQGALLDSWRVFFYDNDAGEDFEIDFVKYYDDITASPDPAGILLSSFTSSGTPGFANHHQVENRTIDLREPAPGSTVTRQQAADFYAFEIFMPNSTDVRFKGVRVFWHRQVSPAPATATFNDVPTSDPAFQYVEALVAAGITAGCNTSPPMYCPDATLTRRQMAVFLAKALGLHWPPF